MEMPIHEGEILAGKYRVERVLGRGGMGVVVAAWHLQLEQRVALKFLLPQALVDAAAVARFLREARASVRLRGEHVARVLDVGTLANGAPYLVMEYLDGTDLAERLHRRGPLPLTEAVDYVLQAAEAVAEAHAAGVVHRDLKPANLFVARHPDGSPCVKVLDFGISKTIGPDDLAMTKTGAVLGSPYYMSPEQMRASRAIDGRSDIWAFGVILCELLTGRVAFEADTFPELCASVLASPAPSLRARRADLPEHLDAIVGRCLAKDAASRYASLAEFAADLAPFAPASGQLCVERIRRLLTNDAPPLAPDPPGAEPRAAKQTELLPAPAIVRTADSFRASRGQVRGASAPRAAATVLFSFLLLAGVGYAVSHTWRSPSERTLASAPTHGSEAPLASGTGAPSAIFSSPLPTGAPSAIFSSPLPTGAPSAIFSSPLPTIAVSGAREPSVSVPPSASAPAPARGATRAAPKGRPPKPLAPPTPPDDPFGESRK